MRPALNACAIICVTLAGLQALDQAPVAAVLLVAGAVAVLMLATRY
jgi:hypothetical protein